MTSCKENCLHYEACKAKYEELTGGKGTGGNAKYCKFFKDRSKFIEEKTAHWVEHKTDIEKMREPQMREHQALGLGKVIGQKYIYWTCSNCGGWGNLSSKYCVNCRAEMSSEHLTYVSERIKE